MTGEEAQLRQVATAVRPVLDALRRGSPGVRDVDVEDLVSDVCERVLKRLRSGEDIRDLEPYAKQAARNAFNDLVVSRRFRDERPAGKEDGPVDAWVDALTSLAATSPSRLVVRQEDAHDLRAALQKLSANEQAVVWLRFHEGLSAEEVAERLGYASAATVNTIVSRLRTKLAGLLSPTMLERGGVRRR